MKNQPLPFVLIAGCAAVLFITLFSVRGGAQEPPLNDAPPPAQCRGALLRQPQLGSRKPSVALFKDIIKTLWDNEGLEDELGKTIATVAMVTMDKPFRWKPSPTDTAFGAKPKTIYPIKASFTTCTNREADWLITETSEAETYDCYVEEAFPAWTCLVRRIVPVKATLTAKPAKP